MPFLPTTSAKKPWPAYFLARNTGEVVPLIAVDELPPLLDLVGVPRSLGLEETVGMSNLGIVKKCGRFYRIEIGREKDEMGGDKEDENVTHIPTKVQSSLPRCHPPPPTNSPLPSSLSSSSTFPTPVPTPTPAPCPSPKPTPGATAPRYHPTQGSSSQVGPIQSPQIQLCRHWCTHGICKWGQNCRYRHIMPMTLPGLREVGLSNWPGWWKKMNSGFFNSGSGTVCSGGKGRKIAPKGIAGGRMTRSEDLRERIIRQLRTLETEKSLKERQPKEKGRVKGRGVVRAPENAGVSTEAVVGRRGWEDDDSESDIKAGDNQSIVVEDERGVGKEKGAKKEMLVDV
ncbi:hypothetical protein BGZ60DRAFT_568983 [Tricladium varicosporioides]|nr:hypothetical protein BGZ60DRAFT_568983 [Hymenoscyphus varicosporioides]